MNADDRSPQKEESYTLAALRVERLIRRRFGLLEKRRSDRQYSRYKIHCSNCYSMMLLDREPTSQQMVEAAVNTSDQISCPNTVQSGSFMTIPEDPQSSKGHGLETVEEFSWDDVASHSSNSNRASPSRVRIRHRMPPESCGNFNHSTPRAFVQPIRSNRSYVASRSCNNLNTSGYDTNSTRTSATHSPSEMKQAHTLYVENLVPMDHTNFSSCLESYDQVIHLQKSQLEEAFTQTTLPRESRAGQSSFPRIAKFLILLILIMLIFTIVPSSFCWKVASSLSSLSKLKVIQIEYADHVPI
ncbi:hypothetical protein Ciccas_000457 [Cichlidogyrus casuarinus]|uniref:Uncharacterized protein n=1 Tax=Cichlidogyrus casuarinus TaxID=1844966 RepID=A0ABD2QMV7_9PLAT